MDYQLEIKQIVQFPRCRMYRQFIRTLMEDRTIRASGGSGLFYFAVLCSYANFRTSYRRIGGINYTVYPGEWICSLSDMSVWFRTQLKRQTTDILDDLQARRLITYSLLGRGQVVKFKVTGWRKHNTVLDYNAPCQKDTGFFFLPISTASELVSIRRCSEMDVILDLWMNTIYNDEQVQGSDVGPVVYMRNGTGSPLVGYAELGERWGISKATVGRMLKKLESRDYLSLFSYPGRHGSVIYLRSYLSTMFQVCDILLDKEEVAMTLNISLTPAEVETSISQSASSVSKGGISVSKPAACPMVSKVQQVLVNQGFTCFDCAQSLYKLSPLSDCAEGFLPALENTGPGQPPAKMLLTVSCRGKYDLFLFELTLLRAADTSYGGQ